MFKFLLRPPPSNARAALPQTGALLVNLQRFPPIRYRNFFSGGAGLLQFWQYGGNRSREVYRAIPTGTLAALVIANRQACFIGRTTGTH